MSTFLQNPFVLALASALSSGLLAYVLSRLLGHRLSMLVSQPHGSDRRFRVHLQNLEEVETPSTIRLELIPQGAGDIEDLRLYAGPDSRPPAATRKANGAVDIDLHSTLPGYCTWTLEGRLDQRGSAGLRVKLRAEDCLLHELRSHPSPWLGRAPLGPGTVPAILVAALVFYVSTTRFIFPWVGDGSGDLGTELGKDVLIGAGVTVVLLLAYFFARHRSPFPMLQSYHTNPKAIPLSNESTESPQNRG